MKVHQKRLFGSLVATLLLATGFATLLTPTATAASGPAPDVVYDATSGEFTAGDLVYGMVRDLVVVRIPCSPVGCIPGSEYVLLFPGQQVNPQPGSGIWNTSEVAPGGGSLQVTFDGVTFDHAGDWRVANRQTQAVTATVPVLARPYEIEPIASRVYDGAGDTGRILKLTYVDDAGVQQPGRSAAITVFYGTDIVGATTTNQKGEFLLSLDYSEHGAGTYRIHAERAESNDDIPDYVSGANDANFTFRILPDALTVTKVTGDAFSGFPTDLRFNVTTPGGRAIAPGTEGATFALLDVTTGTWNSSVVTKSSDNLTRVGFVPAVGRQYELIVNYSSVPDDAPEYIGNISIPVTTSPPLRLEANPPTLAVIGSPTGDVGSFDQEFRLTITGDAHNVHPGWGEADAKRNLTVTGNTLYPAIIRAIDPSQGLYGITVFPHRGGENITVTANWNGVTRVLGIPVTGLRVILDRSQISVDQDTGLRVTVIQGSAAVMDANVTLYAVEGSGPVRLAGVTGDGTTDKGANGVYLLTAAPPNLTEVLVVARANGAYGYGSLRAVPAHDLQVALAPTGPFLTGAPTEVTATITLPPNSKVHDGVTVYLLNATQNAAFARTPFQAPASWFATFTRTSPGVYTYSAPSGLPAGTYHLFAVEPGQHDNLDGGPLPSFVVGRGSVAFSPATLVVGMHEGRTVNVTLSVGGVPLAVDGLLTPQGEGTAPGGVLSVVNGRATFQAGTVLTEGSWNYTFTPTGGTESPVTGALTVEMPVLSVTPGEVYVGELNQVVATVTSPSTGMGLAGAQVRLEQGSAVITRTTDQHGRASFDVTPPTETPIRVLVNGLQLRELTPLPALAVKFDAPSTMFTPGQRITGTVVQRGFSAVAVPNATVSLSGVTVITGADGRFAFNASAVAGTYNLTATEPGFRKPYVATITVSIAGTGPQAAFHLSNLTVKDMEGAAATALVQGDTLAVTVDVRNTGEVAGAYTLRLLKNGTLVDTKAVTLDAGAQETVRFEHVLAAAGTYAFTVNDLAAVNVAVAAKDTQGNQVTPKVTPGEEPGIPGFEAVAALAALGAALLVLRRRSA